MVSSEGRDTPNGLLVAENLAAATGPSAAAEGFKVRRPVEAEIIPLSGDGWTGPYVEGGDPCNDLTEVACVSR